MTIEQQINKLLEYDPYAVYKITNYKDQKKGYYVNIFYVSNFNSRLREHVSAEGISIIDAFNTCFNEINSKSNKNGQF